MVIKIEGYLAGFPVNLFVKYIEAYSCENIIENIKSISS